MNDIDLAARRAMEAQTKTPWRVQLKLWVQSLDAGKIFIVLVTFAFLVGFTIYEGLNAAAGWVLIAQGAVPQPAAFVFGFGTVLGVIAFHRMAGEDFERGKTGRAWRSVVVVLGCMALALLGVFSNLSSKTAVSAQTATNVNFDNAALRAEMTTLRRTSSDAALANAETLVEVTQGIIESLEAEAVGWQMDGTTPEDCAQDLRTAQRNICNQLNGTGGDLGYRNELLLAETALSNVRAGRERLEEIQGILRNAGAQEGAAHWEAMSDVSLGRIEADAARIWATFLASLVVLIVLGFGWDRFFDAREKELENAMNLGG